MEYLKTKEMTLDSLKNKYAPYLRISGKVPGYILKNYAEDVAFYKEINEDWRNEIPGHPQIEA